MEDSPLYGAPDAAVVPVQADYFGFAATERFTLSDGVSFVDLKVLNEGERRKYQNATNREVQIARGTGEAKLKMRPGDDRTALLQAAIVGWNLKRGIEPVAFTAQSLDLFLNSADPALIDRIEKKIRQMNPWLLSDLTVEQIREEIASLEDMLKVKLEEEAGK
jgi:hypothetical protein